ncbi:DMT family transporter [Aureimonas jatrophae]|jgi:drug/metabolite transporter (DMT)-like permease|uniref:EamA domain-containing membrane protein RarD n=1 Tax=Aureimonas jatrophae TaxID=1166073 RepID=A0A1H0HLQ2_9HYPH|nr:DMT family transporter [Aureimonas jatrophae]MBB3950653.1 drug/metabolite transporter (DMT)-like permease [Aureimonas jatrophae]SDO19984.1 EamA domain-containing membrane protein RarD [Aureimonas jatrophae]
MQTGILLAFLAYLAYSCSDAAGKLLGSHMSVFEIGFFVSLIALVPAILSKRGDETWAQIVRPRRPGLVALRVATGTSGGITAVYAFTHLPMAEAYALIFLLPVFVAVLSATVLREVVTASRWLALLGGLAGVLLVVRPGFNALTLGHLSALVCAFCGASSAILLRQLGPTERRLTLVGAVLTGAVVVNGVLMVPTFTMPSLADWPILLFGGLCAGIGNIAMVVAARLAPASRIAPAQYSQIVWAAVLGAVLFGEFPDPLAVAGMALVGFCGMATLTGGTPVSAVPGAKPAPRRNWSSAFRSAKA